MSAISEQEEFEFRLRAEREAAAAARPPASGSDRAWADPRLRAAYGAASLLTGPAQLGAELGGFLNRRVVAPALDAVGASKAADYQRRYASSAPRAVDRGLQAVEASKRRGMEAAGMGGDTDWAGLAGAVAAGGFGARQALQDPRKVVRLVKTLGAGAGFGASAPITDDGGDSRLQNRVEGAALGAGLAGTVGPVAGALTAGARGTGRLASRVVDRFTPGGPRRIAERAFSGAIPEDVAATLATRLREPRNFPEGFNPTASQAVAGTPEGTLIQSLEQVVANQPGNRAAGASPSVMFAQRDAQQAAALDAAKAARNELAAQMRDTALRLANNPSGPQVRAGKIMDKIKGNLSTPGIRASAVVQKTMGSVGARLAGMADDRGVVNADDLYMLRKELGNEIESAMKDSSSFDKKLAGGLRNDLQDAIDTAIEDALPESSKGTWREYLKVYADQSRKIDDAIKAAEDAYKPARRSNMAGVEDGAEAFSFPATLSTAGLLTRSLEAMTRRATGPKVGVELTRIMQNPEDLATILERSATQSGPLRRSMARYFSPAAGAAAGSAQIQE